MKLTSPFADQATASADAPASRQEPTAEQPVEQPAFTPTIASRRPRPGLLELLEARMPGVGSARLPSIATVRAYHKAREYVPWEAALLDWPARVHGWFAVCWVTVFTLTAWAGAGDYPRRFRTLWKVGIPGLFRAQLPPLTALSTVARVWVGCWSAVAWLGLKFWRLPMAALYLLTAASPFLF